jgi:hypothetical protein
MFTGRTLVIATMHEKEKVLAPMLEQALGVAVFVPPTFNTDRFGTFTGDIQRNASPLETARAKAEAALVQTGNDLALASEGSFGPHPVIGIVPANEEWLILIDKKNNIEVVVREISTETNYDGRICRSIDEVLDFAKAAGFPEHGLIIRKNKNEVNAIVKGIRNTEELVKTANTFLESDNELFIETDMRGMMNPTRMKVIATAGEKLIKKLKSLCPSCESPGYDVEEVIPGLPCSACGLPTRTPKAYLYRCKKCGHETTQEFPKGNTAEDPMYCDYCNP